MDAARYCHLGADPRNVNYVPRLQIGISRLVPFQDQIIQVQIGYHGIVPLQLDMAHGTIRSRASGLEQCIHQSTERTHGVSPRPPRVTEYEDLDRSQLANIDVDVKVFKETADGGVNNAIEPVIADTGNGDGAHSGEINLPCSIHIHSGIKVNLAPGANQQLVARSNHVIGLHRNAVHRRERGRDIFEELVTENWQFHSHGGLHVSLKLCFYVLGHYRRLGKGVGKEHWKGAVFSPLETLESGYRRSSICSCPLPPLGRALRRVLIGVPRRAAAICSDTLSTRWSWDGERGLRKAIKREAYRNQCQRLFDHFKYPLVCRNGIGPRRKSRHARKVRYLAKPTA